MSPAPRSAALGLAGPYPRIRRLVLAQVRAHETAVLYLGDAPMAVVVFARHGWRRVEMALAIAPLAAPHMRRMVRFAQLTLAGMAETHLVVARVHPANRAGQRMAALTGFRPARLKRDGFWVFGRQVDGSSDRRRRRGSEAPAGTVAADPGGGQ